MPANSRWDLIRRLRVKDRFERSPPLFLTSLLIRMVDFASLPNPVSQITPMKVGHDVKRPQFDNLRRQNLLSRKDFNLRVL